MRKQTVRRRLEDRPAGNVRRLPKSTPGRPNRSAAGLRIQRKLTLGPASDHYEREADSVARQVMSSLSTSSAPSPEPSSTEGGPVAQRFENLDEDELRMKGDPGLVGGGPISGEIESSIQAARSGGSPLGDAVRRSMEPAFGADFSGVRVHTGPRADSLNHSLQAKAFTTGQDIFFRQGAYSPASRGGQELLAHELTHVVQQNGDRVLDGGE